MSGDELLAQLVIYEDCRAVIRALRVAVVALDELHERYRAPAACTALQEIAGILRVSAPPCSGDPAYCGCFPDDCLARPATRR